MREDIVVCIIVVVCAQRYYFDIVVVCAQIYYGSMF